MRASLKTAIASHAAEHKQQTHKVKQQEHQGLHVLTACGGVGTLPLALKQMGINITKLSGIEWDDLSNDLSRTHHKQGHHSLPQDLSKVSRRHIQDYVAKHGSMALYHAILSLCLGRNQSAAST